MIHNDELYPECDDSTTTICYYCPKWHICEEIQEDLGKTLFKKVTAIQISRIIIAHKLGVLEGQTNLSNLIKLFNKEIIN